MLATEILRQTEETLMNPTSLGELVWTQTCKRKTKIVFLVLYVQDENSRNDANQDGQEEFDILEE